MFNRSRHSHWHRNFAVVLLAARVSTTLATSPSKRRRSKEKERKIYNSWREARPSRRLAFVGDIMSTTSGRGRGSRPESHYTLTRPSRLRTFETRLLDLVSLSLEQNPNLSIYTIFVFAVFFSSHNDSYTYTTRSQSKRKTRYVAYFKLVWITTKRGGRKIM